MSGKQIKITDPRRSAGKEIRTKRRKRNPVITTIKQAKRAIKAVVGFTVVLFGAVLLFIPGPGAVTIVVGLAILGTEFVWARRLLRRFGDSANQIKDAVFNNKRTSKKASYRGMMDD